MNGDLIWWASIRKVATHDTDQIRTITQNKLTPWRKINQPYGEAATERNVENRNTTPDCNPTGGLMLIQTGSGCPSECWSMQEVVDKHSIGLSYFYLNVMHTSYTFNAQMGMHLSEE